MYQTPTNLLHHHSSFFMIKAFFNRSKPPSALDADCTLSASLPANEWALENIFKNSGSAGTLGGVNAAHQLSDLLGSRSNRSCRCLEIPVCP